MIRTKPEDKRYTEDLAEALLQLGEWREAARTYERLLESGPEDFGLLTTIADLYDQADDLEGMARILTRQARLRPDDHTLFLKLAAIRVKQGESDQAGEIYLSVLSADPANQEASKALADLATQFEEQGDLEKAASILEQSLKASPGDKNLRRNVASLAQGYRSKGDTEQALNMYLTLLKAEPDNKDVQTRLYDLALEFEKNENLDTALEILDAILDANPDHDQAAEARLRISLESLRSRTGRD
jgi:tetratricopeptide (TPR) repeat protein